MLKVTIRLQRLSKFNGINEQAFAKLIKKVHKRLPEDCPQEFLEELQKFAGHVEKSFRDHAEKLHNLKEALEALLGEPILMDFDETLAEQQQEESEVVDEIPVLRELVLDAYQPGKIHRIKLAIQEDELSEFIVVPIIIAKGLYDGPVLGITSALHGNELNGVPLIFRLFREIAVDKLRGTLIAIPVLNPPGYQRRQRGFFDSQDLNRLFPGKPDGNCGQVFVHNILEKIVKKFEFHIDLHTASFGRVNSLYVRADMLHPMSHQMALLQHPQIIVHNTAPDGSLRSAAMGLGIPSITVEIGNPLVFHTPFVENALYGVENVMKWLQMQDFDEISTEASEPREQLSDVPHRPATPKEREAQEIHTTVCARSKWIYAGHGGILRVPPKVNTWVTKGDVLAYVQNLFGDIIKTYRCELDGIVVGKSTNPICSTGDRIVHIGYIEDEFPTKADDGHT
mmetsp:Transcript_4384/g.9647  ORF Transcript_4384/g.9647 Transcript_4384/m.9647 type:complete len:453 (+) Transcript_4384:530-1888(+)